MRSDTLAHRLGPYVHRIQPKSLRGRLALAAVMCSLIAVWATFALVNYVAGKQFTDATERNVAGHLEAFSAFVNSQRDEVGALSNSVAEGIAARGGPAESIDGPHGAAWINRAMAIARCSSMIVIDATGRTVYATGSPVETGMLQTLASQAATAPVGGLAWADRVMIVSRHPVSIPASGTAGFVLAARPLDPAVRSRFLPLDNSISLTFAAPSATPVAAATSAGPFPSIRTTILADGTSRTLAALPGVTQAQAGVAELVVHDERITDALQGAVRAALATAVLVSVLGIGVGLTLAAAVRRPIERTRLHLREEGARALEGGPVKPAHVRPETTTEFVELAHEVDALLEALSSRQKELVTTTDQARKAEETLRAAVDGSPEMKLIVEDGIVVLANKAAERLTGASAEDIVGKPSPEVIREAQVCTEDGLPLTVERALELADTPILVRFTTRSGEERWGELTTVRMSPDLRRVLISARDITEERRLEALREEIFSLVSHDLRAPLTVVQGYLDILERPLQPEARARALESARHNARKMHDLLEDLLDATAPEELLTPKVLQPISLCAVAKDVVSSMQAAAHGHSIVMVCEHDAFVSGEERRLRQATVNLVSNAIKYAPEETTVTVRVGMAGGRAVLAVEDEGPGVPAEARDTVFTRYGRLASTERKPGLGLGLYIVRIIAETHGGSARVEDAPGGGARFVIELPLAPRETA